MLGPLLLAALLALAPAAAGAEAIEVTDLAGRTVVLNRPVERFVISEGRYIPLLALLRPDDPVRGVVGMMTTLGLTQPALEAQLLAKFPHARSIPLFGSRSADSVSVEQIIELGPQVAIFGMGDHGPGAGNAAMLRQLEAAGIAVVYIDFRLDPLNNTAPSVELVGRVLGAEARAAAFAAFHRTRLATIRERVAAVAERPGVFVQIHAGREECCWAMAEGMLGPLVGFAGGRNIAAVVAPGPVSQHTTEFLLTENPAVWIATASGRADEYLAGGLPVAVGPGMTPQMAADSLARYLAAPEFRALDAVREGRAHSVWHNFSNSPFNVVAAEAFAAWIHPALFPDVDPQATLARIFAEFLPFEVDGAYVGTLRRD